MKYSELRELLGRSPLYPHLIDMYPMYRCPRDIRHDSFMRTVTEIVTERCDSNGEVHKTYESSFEGLNDIYCDACEMEGYGRTEVLELQDDGQWEIFTPPASVRFKCLDCGELLTDNDVIIEETSYGDVVLCPECKTEVC